MTRYNIIAFVFAICAGVFVFVLGYIFFVQPVAERNQPSGWTFDTYSKWASSLPPTISEQKMMEAMKILDRKTDEQLIAIKNNGCRGSDCPDIPDDMTKKLADDLLSNRRFTKTMWVSSRSAEASEQSAAAARKNAIIFALGLGVSTFSAFLSIAALMKK